MSPFRAVAYYLSILRCNAFSYISATLRRNEAGFITVNEVLLESNSITKSFVIRSRTLILNSFSVSVRMSRPEKGLQKRVNLMQQTTNSDLSRHYLPRQLRHLILQEYLSGVKTARQLSEEHGIPMSTIHKMGQRWKAKNSCSFVSTPNPFPIMSRVTRKKPVNCYPRTKPFGGTWKRLYYVWKAMRSWEISSRKIRCRPAKKSAAGQSGASKKDTQE